MSATASNQRNTGSIPALLTIREVANAMRCSEGTVRNRIEDGTISHVRVHGIVRVPAAALEELLLPIRSRGGAEAPAAQPGARGMNALPAGCRAG